MKRSSYKVSVLNADYSSRCSVGSITMGVIILEYFDENEDLFWDLYQVQVWAIWHWTALFQPLRSQLQYHGTSNHLRYIFKFCEISMLFFALFLFRSISTMFVAKPMPMSVGTNYTWPKLPLGALAPSLPWCFRIKVTPLLQLTTVTWQPMVLWKKPVPKILYLQSNFTPEILHSNRKQTAGRFFSRRE